MSRRPSAAQAAAAGRCAWGLTCLARPEHVVRWAGGVPDSRAVEWTRGLGGRQLAQGVVTLLAPSRRVLLAGAAVDVLHAASALGLAVADRDRRRPALSNALTATSWALLGRTLAHDRPRSA